MHIVGGRRREQMRSISSSRRVASCEISISPSAVLLDAKSASSPYCAARCGPPMPLAVVSFGGAQHARQGHVVLATAARGDFEWTCRQNDSSDWSAAQRLGIQAQCDGSAQWPAIGGAQTSVQCLGTSSVVILTTAKLSGRRFRQRAVRAVYVSAPAAVVARVAFAIRFRKENRSPRRFVTRSSLDT